VTQIGETLPNLRTCSGTQTYMLMGETVCVCVCVCVRERDLHERYGDPQLQVRPIQRQFVLILSPSL